MSEDIQQTVSSVVSKIFETMFFIFIEAQEEPEDPAFQREEGRGFAGQRREGSADVRVCTEIGFHGRRSGILNLFLPCDLARKMAGNFMGLGEMEICESQVLDVAKEFTNMISGNLFSLLEEKADYQITTPKARMIREEEISKTLDPSASTMTFFAEGHKFILQLILKARENP